MVELPGVLLFLELSLAERGVQHDVVPESGDGQAHRFGPVRRGPEEICGRRTRLRQDRARRPDSLRVLPLIFRFLT